VRTGIGLLAGVNLVEDVSADLITRVCLQAGILLRALPDNTLQISPPFVIEAGDLWRIAGAIAVALDHPDLPERQGSGPALDHVESDDV
jgi:adenosylmethionine-8-amino-7-oxononanoate aminotransferase